MSYRHCPKCREEIVDARIENGVLGRKSAKSQEGTNEQRFR